MAAADAESAATYHFAGGKDADAQVVTNLQALGKFNVAQLSQLVEIVAGVTRGSEQAADEKIAQFAGEHNVKIKALNRVTKASLFFFQECVKRSCTPDQINQDLASLGLDDEHVAVVLDKYASLSAAAESPEERPPLGKKLEINQLVDMQWKFGVTVATDEQKHVGSTFLQLLLKIDKGQDAADNVAVELTLPQFYRLLKQMQQVATLCESATM